MANLKRLDRKRPLYRHWPGKYKQIYVKWSLLNALNCSLETQSLMHCEKPFGIPATTGRREETQRDRRIYRVSVKFLAILFLLKSRSLLISTSSESDSTIIYFCTFVINCILKKEEIYSQLCYLEGCLS
jgi:hypothetical protein